MGGEQGRHQVHRVLGRGPADGAELLQLVVGVEAVAALRLGGGGAPGKHLVHAPADVGHQLVLARPAGGRNGGENAAAGRRDLLVGRAGQPGHELLLAAAGPGQVSVGIDEPGNQGAAPAVEPFGRRQLAEEPAPLPGIAGEGDPPVAAQHLGARQAADAPLIGSPPRRRPVRRRHLGEVMNQQISHGRGF